jgi:hypothetical protein
VFISATISIALSPTTKLQQLNRTRGQEAVEVFAWDSNSGRRNIMTPNLRHKRGLTVQEIEIIYTKQENI